MPEPMPEPRVIAVLGAESTGKSTLAAQLCARLHDEGRRVARVDEYLREFCDAHGRTPHVHEQAAIAAEQTRRIRAAAADHDIVVADTTALMIAVYSDWVFADRSLYASALAAQQGCTMTLLTALDLPWQPDGLQRDGEHVREPVDALLRAALWQGGIGFSVIGGHGPDRLAAARAAIAPALLGRQPSHVEPPARWRHVCERCGDPDCERHLLARR
jgi:nicotinamide riboside kinase